MIKIQISLILLFFLIDFSSYGQSELYGLWKVNCPIEYTGKNAVAFCGICPATQENNTASIENFEMEITAKEINIQKEHQTTAVPFKWDDAIKTLTFSYDKNNYVFKVLITDRTDLLIWKDKGGLLLLLQRK